jgi:hypothetical protein
MLQGFATAQPFETTMVHDYRHSAGSEDTSSSQREPKAAGTTICREHIR